MASHSIQAVLFDMGGTLEELYSDNTVRRRATRGLRELLLQRGVDPGLSLPDLEATVSSGLKAYQAWRAQTERELAAERVWTEFIFVDHGLSTERLLAAAEDLAFFHESRFHTRYLRPEAHATLDALHTLGFRLAIISNVISRRLVPEKLAEYNIAHYFDPVVTSSGLGWRKPNERIFDEAVRLLQIPPEACAYVGDTVSRDVIGARRAGFGLAIQIRSFLTERSDRGTANVQPDAVIDDLREVIDLVTVGRERSRDH